jgi:dynein heavy chain, axonemal
MLYVGCSTPPAGNNCVDPRLMSLFTVFNVTPPSKDSTMKIFNLILSTKVKDFPEDVQSSVNSVTQATLLLY